LAYLRRAGFTQAEACERWLPRINRRRDLLRVADVIALRPRDRTILLVQVTSLPHVADRLKRVQTRPELRDWLRCGGSFELHGWVKRSGRWQVKVVAVRAEDLAAEVLVEPPRRRCPRKGEGQRLLFE
jgi:hypothetical protein